MHDAAQSQSNCGVLVSSSQGLSVKNPSLLSARQANLSSFSFSSSSSATFSSVSSSISHFLRLFLHASLHSISPSCSQIFLTPSIDLRIPLLDVDERVRFSRKSLSNDAPLPPLRSVECLWSLHHNRFPTLAPAQMNQHRGLLLLFGGKSTIPVLVHVENRLEADAISQRSMNHAVIQSKSSTCSYVFISVCGTFFSRITRPIMELLPSQRALQSSWLVNMNRNPWRSCT